MNQSRRGALLAVLTILFFVAGSPVALAHVKWFAGYGYGDPPEPLGEVITGVFIALALLSVAVILFFVFLDLRWSTRETQTRISAWLEGYKQNSLFVMRIGTGFVLLFSWQADTVLAPELHADSVWIGWAQFFLAFLLLFRQTVPLVGLGVLALVMHDISRFGLFHMLDYALMLGVGWYLVVGDSKSEGLRGTALPALYATTGFSLCWVATEKIIYPGWALELLHLYPHLTMGLDHSNFLLACAFIEFSLGFLLIFCVLQRELALTITIVFILTSMTFGKVEVIGHSIIHAILIVFLIEGPGRIYRAPITFPNRLVGRLIFAGGGFLLLLVILLPAYEWGARRKYESFVPRPGMHRHDPVEIADGDPVPKLKLKVYKDRFGGWNLELVTSNFTFAPASGSEPNVEGEGHAHLYVDGAKTARLYGRWFHVPILGPGDHDIKVTLNANNHGVLTVGGEPIQASAVLASE